MKKRIVVLTIIIVIIILVIFGIKPLLNYIQTKQVENSVVRFLNRESNDHAKQSNIEEIEYALSDVNSNYDISSLIELYIKVFEEVINAKKENRECKEIKLANWNSANANTHGMDLGTDIMNGNIPRDSMYAELMEKEEITGNEFINNLINKIEKIIIHKGKDKYNNWYISSNSTELIELPYGFFIKYKPGDRVINTNIKKIIGCKYNPKGWKFESYLPGKPFKIKYETIDGNIEDILLGGGVENVDGGFIFRIVVIDFLYKQTQRPRADLKHEVVDKKRKEVQDHREWISIRNNLMDFDMSIYKYFKKKYESDIPFDELQEEYSIFAEENKTYRDQGLTLDERREILSKKWGLKEEE